MSKSILRRSLMAVTVATAMSSAYAATQVRAVTGTLAQWKAWNAAQKAPMPYTNAAAGVDLFESSVAGENKIANYGKPFFNMPVTGTVTFDDITGVVSALVLTQSSPIKGFYDVDGDGITDDTQLIGTSAVLNAGSVTFSNLAWILNTGTNIMSQTAGNAAGCTSGFAACAFTVTATNANPHDNGTNQSPLDFQGISAGFETLPNSNAALNGYGVSSFKTWTETPGAATSAVNFCTGTMTVAVASRTDTGTETTNAANTATFTLAVPNTGTFCLDNDFDGIPDSQDPDDDNDGVSDLDEVACGTDPLNAASKPTDLDSCAVDTDADGVPDYRDVFPNDPTETLDTDGDKIGNNADTDDDGDLVSDTDEALKGSNPLLVDTDGDGLNDNSDPFPANAAVAVEDETKYSQIKLSLPGCPKASRVNSTTLAILPSQYALSFGDGLQMFGDYTQKGKKYSLKPTSNSVTLLQNDLTAWANTVCGGNTTVTSISFSKNELKVNKQKTQGVLSIKAKVNAIVKGKNTTGSYTVSATLPLTTGAPQ